jgi:putative MATE family efflux protein
MSRNARRDMPAQNILDTDRIGPLLVKLATPAFFGMFVQTMYNVVNTIFIGQFVGVLAIAGLSIVFPLQMVAMGIGMMVGMGGSSLISRFLGAGDNARAELTIGNGITVALVMSVVVTIIILPLVNFWLRLIGASDAVLPYARDYLVIVISGTIINVFAMTLLNFTRAEGNARVGMTSMMLGAFLNIILDAIFIVALHLGVKGAAYGTIIGQTVSMVYLLLYYVSGSSYLKIRWRNLRPDFSILKQMFAIGIAAFVQTIAGSLSAMLLINMVVRYGGDIALGAFGIIQRIMMFATMPAMVLGQGVQPILGYNYGAKRYRLALKAIYISSISATTLSAAAFLVLYFIPGPIMRIFTSDQALIDMGAYASRLVFLSMPFMGMVMVGQTLFQALGKAMQSFITAIVRPVVFLIPLVLILSNLWQLDGVFLAFPVSDVLTLLLIFGLASPILAQLRKGSTAENQGNSTDSFSRGKVLESEETPGVSD